MRRFGLCLPLAALLSGCWSTTTAPSVTATYGEIFIVEGGKDVPFMEFEKAAHRWCAHQGKRAKFAKRHGGDGYDANYAYTCVMK